MVSRRPYQGARREQANSAVDRIFGVPLVSRDGARELRRRSHREDDERAVREHQSRSRRTTRSRQGLPDRASVVDPAGRRLAADHVPRPEDVDPVLRRHLLSKDATLSVAGIRRSAAARFAGIPRSARRTDGAGHEARQRVRQSESGGCAGTIEGRRVAHRGARPARRAIRCARRRLRHRAEVPDADHDRTVVAALGVHRTSAEEKRAERPRNARNGDDHADAHRARRHLRSRRRRLLPLLDRRALDDSALRKNAVRQRRAARASMPTRSRSGPTCCSNRRCARRPNG